MGNLISRPGCLGQKSKKVTSEENYLRECYRRKECPSLASLREKSEAVTLTPAAEKPRSPPPVAVEREWQGPNPAAKTPLNGTLPRKSDAEMGKQTSGVPAWGGTVEREQPPSFQRQNSGSPWSWKTLASREVTEVTEVTETIVTEIVEVTEFPSGEKGGDPIITRTVRVLTGAAEELSEVNMLLIQLLKSPHTHTRPVGVQRRSNQ